MAGITCLFSSPLPTEAVGNGQDRGAGEEGKSPSSPQKFVQPSHKSVSLHYSTPQLPCESFPGMSERRKIHFLPMFTPDGRGTWENVERDMKWHGHEVLRDWNFHQRAKKIYFWCCPVQSQELDSLWIPSTSGHSKDSKTE